MRALLTSSLVLLLGASGCAPSAGPVYISRFFPLGTSGCDISAAPTAGVFESGGTLDVAPGAPDFFVGLEFNGGMQVKSTELIVGGTSLEPVSRDRPIINLLAITYSSSPKLPGMKAYNIPRMIPVDPTSGIADTYVNLLSPEVSTVLEGLSPGDSVALSVTVEGHGFMSNSGSAINTGPAVFPIKVIKSTLAGCTKLQRSTGPCSYLGQAAHSIKPALVCCAGAMPGCDY
jgi:hypothetical protein